MLRIQFGETRAEHESDPESSQNRRGTWYPAVSERHRVIVFCKPKRIARDIEEHGFSDLHGKGRRFEACSAHAKKPTGPAGRRASG